MPGPPRGPSYAMTTTSPALMRPARIASHASSCEWKTRAGPSKWKIDASTPAVLTMAPSVARLPKSTASPPSLLYACSTSRMQPPTRSRSGSSK